MAIRNIIQKAEQEFPPALKQELDPIAIAELAILSGYINTVDSNLATTGSTLNTKIDNLSGYSNNTFYTNDNPSGFITGVDTSNFYTNDNPSGFITGVDTSNFYTNDNPSGFVQSQPELETPSTGVSGINNIVYLSQSTYDGLTIKLSTTLYFIV